MIARRLGAWTEVMLVGQDHFVEIGRDGDFVVGEIAEPGAAAVDGVGQEGQHFGQRDGDGLRRAVVRARRWRFRIPDRNTL